MQGPGVKRARGHSFLHGAGAVCLREAIVFEERGQRLEVHVGEGVGVHRQKVFRLKPFLFLLPLIGARGLVVNERVQRLARCVVGQTDAAGAFPFRKVAHRTDPVPLGPSVNALPNPRTQARFGEVVRPAGAFPGGGEQVVGVVVVHHQVHKPSVGSRGLQYLGPLLSAVFCSVHTSFAVVGIQASHGGHPNSVGVVGVHGDAPHVMRAVEAGVPPRLSEVVAEVHAVPCVGTSGRIHFA